MKPVAFATRRCWLRPLEAADEALYCRLYTSPTVMAHIGEPLAPSVARRQFATACRLNAATTPAELRWAVLDDRSRDGIGLLALIRDARDATGAELGFMLVPEVHGRGLGRELAEGLLQLAFGPDGGPLQRIRARHAPAHAAVVAILSACGFQRGPPRGAAATMVLGRTRWRARQA